MNAQFMKHVRTIAEWPFNRLRTLVETFTIHLWTAHGHIMNGQRAVREPFMKHVWCVYERTMHKLQTTNEPFMKHVMGHKAVALATWSVGWVAVQEVSERGAMRCCGDENIPCK